MSTDLKSRLYLSGIDPGAFAMAEASGFGFEETAFCSAPMMEDASTLEAAEKGQRMIEDASTLEAAEKGQRG